MQEQKIDNPVIQPFRLPAGVYLRKNGGAFSVVFILTLQI